MNYAEHVEQDARLRICQALNRQTDGRLSDRMLVHELDAWGIRRTPDWVRTQLFKLRDLGAVTLPIERDDMVVAEITRSGLDHVDRRGVIAGVRRPEPGEA